MKTVSFKVTDDISEYLNSKANKSEYIRQLVIADMHKKDISEERLKEIIRDVIAGREFKESVNDLTNEIDIILSM